MVMAVHPSGCHAVCAWIFCTRKNKKTYLKIFQLIREAVNDPNWAPEVVHVFLCK